MDFMQHQNPLKKTKHTISEGEKIAFIAILVVAVVVVGWVLSGWRGAPSTPRVSNATSTQRVLTNTPNKQNVQSSLTAPSVSDTSVPAVSQNVLDSLTAQSAHTSVRSDPHSK